jgi:hypothetical protein
MKKIVFSITFFGLCGAGFAQTDSIAVITDSATVISAVKADTAVAVKSAAGNRSVARFKEQLDFSPEQAAKLDSVFAYHVSPADTAVAALCKRAKDAEIMAILTPAQREKYKIMKVEWREQQEKAAAAIAKAAAPPEPPKAPDKKPSGKSGKPTNQASVKKR